MLLMMSGETFTAIFLIDDDEGWPGLRPRFYAARNSRRNRIVTDRRIPSGTPLQCFRQSLQVGRTTDEAFESDRSLELILPETNGYGKEKWNHQLGRKCVIPGHKSHS